MTLETPPLFGCPLALGPDGIRKAQVALQDFDKDRKNAGFNCPLPDIDPATNAKMDHALECRRPLPHGLKIFRGARFSQTRLIFGYISKNVDQTLQATIYTE